MTVAEFLEGAKETDIFKPTPEEIEEQNKPKPNGGIPLDFRDWLETQQTKQ